MHEASSAPVEALAGLVERVTFHNADTGFCVLRVKARGHRDLITVVGHAASIAAGEWVQMSGLWLNDRTHGLQFKANFLKATQPTTREGIEKYLGSGMIRGIGPVYAKKLVGAFGEAVFDIIASEPHRLREVTGIGPKRAARIIAGGAEQKIIREIMLFLHTNGVGTSRAVRIYKTYGAEAVQLITENPYRLARDIRGIGFRTADQVAQKLGIEPTAMIRVRAGISFALAEATGEGHCGLPETEVLKAAHRINRGLMPELKQQNGSDFYFVDAGDPEDGVAKLLAVVQRRIPERFGLDAVRDIQILCPMNRGGLGARSLNIELQKALNPPGEVKVERFGWTFGVGDKVMQTTNDYEREVYNGDLGLVSAINMEESELTVAFDGRDVTYGFGELDELVLAYATTIHKSQGSEYPAVVIPLVTQHYTMLARNLLYTGITRGKKLVVLVGQRRALAIAVKNGNARRRWSKLGDWLRVRP